ncbi:MAG: hypothetical protein ACC608_09430 [Anaerofustis sp.]
MNEETQVFDKAEVLKFLFESKKMCSRHPDCKECPWEDLNFDCSIENLTIEHVEKLEEYVNKIRRYEEIKFKLP